MVIKSFKELELFMKQNCYNTDIYGIGKSPSLDGFGIEKLGALFVWFYIERGNRENLNYFGTEYEATKFVYEVIINDRLAKSTLLTSLENPILKDKLTNELTTRKIEFWTDEIPYLGKYGKITRFFIIGCDIKKVYDLIDKF